MFVAHKAVVADEPKNIDNHPISIPKTEKLGCFNCPYLGLSYRNRVFTATQTGIMSRLLNMSWEWGGGANRGQRVNVTVF
ncbi:MAG: hypothetical protein WBG50_11600 [Desulfomonilaceae bacterium]